MAKQSGFMKRMQAAQKRNALDTAAVYQQQTLDAIVIALNRKFGFGPKRIAQFREEFEAVWREMIALGKEDGECGDIEYTKYKIDAALLAAVGTENFIPWNERYRV